MLINRKTPFLGFILNTKTQQFHIGASIGVSKMYNSQL